MTKLISSVAALLSVVGATFAAEDWVVLFDGKDLSHWEAVKNRLSDWNVADGDLYCTGGEGWLASKERFSNFELELEFKLYEGGNSGVFLRAARAGKPAWTGLEVQILDDNSPISQNLQPHQRSGGLYGCVGPSTDAAKTIGKWQKQRIVVNGRLIQVYLNGISIIDANLDDYLANVQKHPGLASKEGYIGLQAHGGRVDFRKIRIKRLLGV